MPGAVSLGRQGRRPPQKASRSLLAPPLRLPQDAQSAGLQGVFRFYELIAPVLPLDKIIYLGEGHTPQVAANDALRQEVGGAFYYKNDGQNPSASFKDRGMAAALSYLNFLVNQPGAGKMLAICASTGDTSAAAALYAAYLGAKVASAVLLPTARSPPSNWLSPWAAAPASSRSPASSTTA